MARIPLAWLNFTNSKPRMLASLGGVAFAVVLMFVEMGFSNGLYDSETYLLTRFNAEIIIVSRYKHAIVPKLPFAKTRLVQVRGVPGVGAAYAMYVEEYKSIWKNASDGKEHPILILAFDPADPVLLIPEVLEQAEKLKVLDTALIDSTSRKFYGEIGPGTTAELSHHTIHVVGTFPLGPDFRFDGAILISDRTYNKCLPDPASGQLETGRAEFGLIRVADGYEVEAVRQALRKALPDDVDVLTKAELVDRVKDYWSNSKPIGFVFGLGTVVGFLIGVTICYQILYTDIMDHLPQYATIKAIGYSNGYLMKIVLQQSLFLAIIGFFPGMLCSLGLYAALQSLSGIIMQLTLPRAGAVFVLTLGMCSLSALIAIRKAISSDPAEVF